MKRNLVFGSIVIVFIIVTLACSLTPQADTSLENTQVALSIQQTSIVLEKTNAAQAQPPSETPDVILPPTYTPYPTYTQPPATDTAAVTPTTQPPTETLQSTSTTTATSEALIQQVSTDTKVFYCVPGSGPTTLTITVQVSDVNRFMAVFWRLEEKSLGKKMAQWEQADLRRAGGNTLSFTFDADVWAGTNNFYYPPGYGESWFLYQIITLDGKVRSEVFADVTFFPCAQ